MASPIVGACIAAELGDTLGAAGRQLPAEMRQRLEEVSAWPHRYPRAMEETMAARRNRAVRVPGTAR